ncbi:MAG TPA: glycerol-3-phosphate dehydrogenase/oxidase [Acidimicrobiales bacterium]|jgi:glycerol-3-phosphate dehydrogenase|nr:glycerol-3-phosphate dehydrogenase/oxidase [Acidimicrobiales bacterium]
MTMFSRDAALSRLADEQFDVLVIGGGITGAGVALDAASRGLHTALVERRDFASGTSSKSSKMVHGGLRYLNQRDYRLVYEALYERQRLLRNAPHLVKPLPFLIPLYGGKTIAKALNSALWVYDLTGGIRIGKRHHRISPDDTIAHMPTLRREGLAAGFEYYDAQADDARLTLGIIRTAVLDHGAVAANYAGVTGLLKSGEEIVGARVGDLHVRARVVVNATGVWSDQVRALDEGHDPGILRPAKGIHLSVPWEKVRCDIAVVIPVLKDKRSIFVVPWGDRVYVGTTDTDYEGSLDEPVCTPDDVRYLLEAVNRFLTHPLSADDVLGTWAGLRPLVRDARSERTADLSRRHSVQRSAGGLITVTGGKLTTYRRMAADTVDAAASVLGRGGRCRTARLPLRGAEGFEAVTDEHLSSRYGSEARTVQAMVAADPSLGQPLIPSLPYLRAEAVYAARYEMAHQLDDVLARRTRALLLARDETAAVAGDVARLVAGELGWDDAEAARQVSDFRMLAESERTAAGLSETISL